MEAHGVKKHARVNEKWEHRRACRITYTQMTRRHKQMDATRQGCGGSRYHPREECSVFLRVCDHLKSMVLVPKSVSASESSAKDEARKTKSTARA